MAAYAALVSLLNNIHAIANHPRLSTSLHNTNIQPLLEKIGLLLEFIEGNNYGGGSKEVEDLERKIACAAHAAEDLIESHIVDRIHEARLRHSYLLFLFKFVSCNVSQRSKEPLQLHQINEDMDAILEEANKFKEKHRLGEEQQPTHLAEPPMESTEIAMVGLDAELNHLLDELTDDQPSRRIISIVGMGGTGKTTLAESVYNNPLIKEIFHFRGWATISHQNNAQKILYELLSSPRELSNKTVDDLGRQLYHTLFGRRYLIILDDIWSVAAWDEVKHFFPDLENKSRVVLTTRLSNVATDCSSSLLRMNLLDKVNSLKLFCQKAFKNEYACPWELREVGQEIVRFCKGLPLSIIVIGGLLLNSPRNVGYWKQIAENLKSIPDLKEKEQSLDVLSLSYNHLPPHLKPCFLYMGIFKEDSVIPVSKVIKLWIAEGFIKPIGSRVLEEIAEVYFQDLIDRNLIFVSRRRKNGNVGSFGIHDLLRDLSIKIAEQQQFFHASKEGLQGKERRLVGNWCLEPIGVGLPLARSMIAGDKEFGLGKNPLRLKQVRYRLLRVLDDDFYLAKEGYCGNVNLRYLAYTPDHARRGLKFSSSISFIWNLQTLIHTNGRGTLMVMSKEFWKMQQLRHVQCSRIYLRSPRLSSRQGELLELKNLQTLKTVVNLRLSEKLCKIIPNIKKLHLVYDHSLRGYDDGLIESVCNLHHLRKLNSLNLLIRGLTEDRELKKKLTTSFPESLKKLSLRECRFHWDDITNICSLPQLEVLNLSFFSTRGEQWSFDEQFRRLKFLKIQQCRLVRWDVDDSNFPVLERLMLFDLDRLEEIPLAVGNAPTLELIVVFHCSESAAISAVKIKEEQLEYGNQLQVEVSVQPQKVESFKERLEMEELTLNNIQFQPFSSLCYL